MSSFADTGARTGPEQPVIHPFYVRVTHWINAVAILIMIGSALLANLRSGPSPTAGEYLLGGKKGR